MGFILLQASSWAFFIGRFHPLLVHLPIGFMLIALLLEIGRRTGKIGVSESTISFVLFWSAVGATFACVAGYLLSLGGGYDAELLEDHMWAGIAVAVFAWIAWAVKSDYFSGKIPFAPVFYLPSFILATVFLLSAGHDGGSLTHGEEYLTHYTPEPFRSLAGIAPLEQEVTEIKPIANINEAVVYKEIIQPILKQKCTQCHNATKQKGDLRLDELSLITKGGKNGPAFVAGKSAESDMIKRCLLPENNDDHMPPKGKPQLSPDQVSLISWWIDQGAPAEKKVSELAASDELKPILAKLTGSQSKESGPSISALDKITASPPDAKAIEGLKKAGLIVNQLSADKNLLEVSAVNAPAFDDKQMALLLPLADQIVWLKIGRTKISDLGMKELSKFKNLNKLHIEHTQVSDAGLTPLTALGSLEYLNMVDTKVSDSGLKSILASKSLKSVYVWQSEVTDSAVAGLQKSYPGVKIIGGFDENSAAIFAHADSSAYAAPKKK